MSTVSHLNPVPTRRTNRLLASLPAAEFSALAPEFREMTLERGMILRESGDPIQHVYFPHSGLISILAVLSSGEAIETATVGFEGAVGVTAALGSRLTFGRAMVQLPGTASRISSGRFQAIAAESSALRELMLRYNEVMLAQTQQAAACNILHDVEARLCRWLLHTHDRLDGDVVPLTQEFLAEMLGVRRTTVTIVARVLQSAGMIRYRRGHIHILNRAALEEGACECYGIVHQLMDDLLPNGPAGGGADSGAMTLRPFTRSRPAE